MNTLPAEIQEYYYSLNEKPSTENAQLLMTEFFKEFPPEKAEQELWLLLSGALTSTHLPYASLPEERGCMLHFYEWMKVVVKAGSVLKGGL
jgi:hypothetical protein